MSVIVLHSIIGSEGTQVSAAAPTTDVSSGAIQKPHTTGVPHTDSAGNFKSVYDQNSFLPLGIYNPTLCQVTKSLSWAPYAGYSGEYRIKVHYGTSRGAGTYMLADINVGTGTSNQLVGNLPPSSQLHYSIWLHGTQTVINEGNFTSDPCTNAGEDNNLESIKNAGFNLAILEKNVYPDASYLAKSQASGVRLLLDLRDRPSNTFFNLKDNANVFGFYVGDDDLARARATGADPGPVYNDINSFADSLDVLTSKIILTAEPNVEANAGANWLDWYNQFDSIGNVSFHYNYPKSNSPLIPWYTMVDVADTVKHQVETNGSNRPSWFITQAINLKWVIPLEFPTPVESRAMRYTAIIHGATGLFDFSYDGWFRRQPKGNPAPANQNNIDWWDRHAGIKVNTPISYPGGDKWRYDVNAGDQSASTALWNSVDASQNGVNKQLIDLKSIILSPTSADDYKVFVDRVPTYNMPGQGSISPTPIRTMLKQYAGDTYLFAVNIVNEPITAKFELTGKNFVAAEVMFEGRNATLLTGNTISEDFGAFDVNVYKLTPVATLPTNKFKTEYFNEPDFTEKVLEREEDKAKLGGSVGVMPVPQLNPDGIFSARWEGNFDLTAGKYRVSVSSGASNSKVYFDGNLIWNGTTIGNALVDVSAGLHTIKVEYAKVNAGGSYQLQFNFADRLTCFDMTGDNVINVADRGVVASKFGLQGQTPWDVNRDNIINVADVGIIAQRHGRQCPHTPHP